MGLFNKKKKIGESEDANFAKYSERIFSNDEGLKNKSLQDFVTALEDREPFYFADDFYLKLFYEMDRETYVFNFYRDKDEEPCTTLILDKEEFDQFFDYVVAVRENIYSNITMVKDGTEINIGRNLTDVYKLDVVENKQIKISISGTKTMFIKLVHAMIYAKHYKY